MLNNFFKNSNFIFYNVLLITFFLVTINFKAYSQTLTNLDVFYSLTDSLVDQINSEIPSSEKKIILTLNLGQTYSIFSNSIKDRFIKSGREIFERSSDDLNIPQVNIVFEGAGAEYGEMFRDGWFGAHHVQRHSTIFGNYLQSFSEGKKEFEITRLDTVKVEDISNLESESYPFTKGSIPPEPFLSGFAEPLIAIGTAAVAIVLFFTIRSE